MGEGERFSPERDVWLSLDPPSFADLNFDKWELYPQRKPVEAGVGEGRELKLHGDALLVSYHESASGLYYWDGKRIRWYQQGD